MKYLFLFILCFGCAITNFDLKDKRVCNCLSFSDLKTVKSKIKDNPHFRKMGIKEIKVVCSNETLECIGLLYAKVETESIIKHDMNRCFVPIIKLPSHIFINDTYASSNQLDGSQFVDSNIIDSLIDLISQDYNIHWSNIKSQFKKGMICRESIENGVIRADPSPDVFIFSE